MRYNGHHFQSYRSLEHNLIMRENISCLRFFSRPFKNHIAKSLMNDWAGGYLAVFFSFSNRESLSIKDTFIKLSTWKSRIACLPNSVFILVTGPSSTHWSVYQLNLVWKTFVLSKWKSYFFRYNFRLLSVRNTPF